MTVDNIVHGSPHGTSCLAVSRQDDRRHMTMTIESAPTTSSHSQRTEL